MDSIFHKAWERGIVLSGVSAGSICWFEEGVTDSYGDGLEPLPALGFIGDSNCPHYDGEAERKPVYRWLVTEKRMQPGLAADDGAALHFIGQELHAVVSSRPNEQRIWLTKHQKLHWSPGF